MLETRNNKKVKANLHSGIVEELNTIGQESQPWQTQQKQLPTQ